MDMDAFARMSIPLTDEETERAEAMAQAIREALQDKRLEVGRLLGDLRQSLPPCEWDVLQRYLVQTGLTRLAEETIGDHDAGGSTQAMDDASLV